MTANKKTNNVDNTKEFTAIEWCAGYGGIHLGLKRAIPNLRVIAYGEIEAFACANLVAKMEAGLLDPAPLWTDIKTFPCEDFRDRVDLLVAGYPCQPFSAAGKRLGADDPRHLWPHIARAIGIIRPRLCFFENVEGHISLGLREVIGELESIGYQTAWGIFSAAEVGAPHQRKRVFILAVSNSLGGAAGLSRSLAWNERFAGVADNGGGEGCYKLGDSSSEGHARPAWSSSECPQRQPIGYTSKSNGSIWPSRPGQPQHGWEPPRVVANGNGSKRRPDNIGTSGQGEQESSEIGTCCEQLANDNGAHAGYGEQRPERTLRDLSGGCGEKLGNAESWWRGESRDKDSARQGHWTARPSRSDEQHSQAQPALGGDPDGPAGGLGYAELCVSCDNRTDELRLLGNGVVPATAERAFRILMGEIISA